MSNFKLISDYTPKGDQPKAIDQIVKGLNNNKKFQTLLGVTGSGKTFSMANVIEKINKPTLVISHNKTLAAQLYAEFKSFFPENAVEYFVSYYDYYQPEAYIPRKDLYIEKDASINENLDKLRLSATSSLMSRKDVIVISSVSCIYNLGSPEEYSNMFVVIKKGENREAILKKLVEIQYERNNIDFSRGKFRVRGEMVEICPSYTDIAYRITFDFDEVIDVVTIDPISGEKISKEELVIIYPAKHFVTSQSIMDRAINDIMIELQERLEYFNKQGKLLEAQRLKSKTLYDIEMMKEVGYCTGIENYSRQISNRPPGSRPWCLIDYFPEDFITIIDESHVTIPQVRGMFNGDQARKKTLVDYGFRLPSALDNRPLKFDEFEKTINQVIFASATPSDYEAEHAPDAIEQIIRPTGLIDPTVQIRPSDNQVKDLIKEVKLRAEKHERTFVTTITKRLAEDLCAYMQKDGIKVKWLHSELDAIERVQILKELRLKHFDCLVGVNLLREGLDIPEVSLVAVLDADKEGFLRSTRSLIQVSGRAARNINGTVIMYADKMTNSMNQAIKEMNRRRSLQMEYNKKHKIEPASIKKAISDGIEIVKKTREVIADVSGIKYGKDDELIDVISDLEERMQEAARNLDFEKAIKLRTEIKKLEAKIK